MTYIRANGVLYEADVKDIRVDHEWDGRAVKLVTLEMTTAEASNIFVDGLKWSVLYREVGGSENIDTEFDNSAYNVAGSITDNRNGTVSVKMGKPSQTEQAARLEARMTAVEEAMDILLGVSE